ncbi:MAG: BACON domain-containing protein [Prevotella sp.]|nr:BACON domain-containing protein [Prevotella sp.]
MKTRLKDDRRRTNWLRPLLLLLIVSSQLSIVSSFAQQTQDALYIYRNDGGFNAFFFRDIERIAFSKVDTLGVEHDDYVVQEVYALDSLFRIPVSAIDSVAFVTPETKYRTDVAYTTESGMWDYVIASDSITWLLLNKNIPSALVPKVGDKLVTLNQTEMLPAGFVGRVVTVQNESDGIRVNCGQVELTEIFEQYVCKVDAYGDSDESASGARGLQKAEYKGRLPLSPISRTLHLTASYSLGAGFSFDGNGSLGIAVKPTVDMRVFLAVSMNTGVNFDMVMRGDVETQVQFALNGIANGHFDFPIVKNAIPVTACPLLWFKVEVGLFSEIQGSLNIGATYSTTEKYYGMCQFNSLLEGGRQATASVTHVKDTLMWNDVTAKATFNFGGYVKKSLTCASTDITESGLRTEMGLRAEVESPANWSEGALLITDGLAGAVLDKTILTNQERSRKLYDQVDLATITLSRFSNVQAFSSMLKWTFTKKWENVTQIGNTMGIVPHIGKPIVHMATQYDNRVRLHFPMERDLLFPVKVGADIYNNKNQLVAQVNNDVPYAGSKSGQLAQSVYVAGLPETGRYKAFPRMEIFGRRLYGEPTDSFSAAKAMLDVPVKRVTVPSNVGHVDLKVNTNFDNLTFTPTVKWLNYAWNSFDKVLTVYYETLPTGMNDRKGSIRIVAHDGDGTELAAEEIEITQVLAVIELSTTELNVGVKGGANVIDITSTNCKDLKATTKSNFLHPDVSGNTVSILVDPNPSTEAREGTVIVSGLLESVGVRVERIISISQAGTMTPEETEFFNDSQLTLSINGSTLVNNPLGGKTVKQGDYIVYKSGETKVKGSGDNKTETSWQIELYIDPNGDNMMHDYKLAVGSLSYLHDYYYTTGSGEDVIKHRRTERYSYNINDLGTSYVTTDYMVFGGHNAEENGNSKITDFSYTVVEDGKQTIALSQADLNADEGNGLRVVLYFADDVPVLDADVTEIETDGQENYRAISVTSNKVVQKVELTTSDDWLTVDDDYYKIYWTTNTSKADRVGYVYLTGTLADGSTITRTITVKQKYERIWDDEWNISEDQKAELPSEAVLTELRNHGMPLYLGTEPPSVNGVFEMTPLELVYSVDYENSEDAEEGEVENATHVFNITSLTGANPKAKLLSYSIYPKYNYKSPASEFFCYYGGDGKHFTLSNITTYKDDNPLGLFTMTYVTMISGEIDGNQIKNLHYAYVDLGENGDEIVAVAIMKDGDGVSTTTKWDPGVEEDEDD